MSRIKVVKAADCSNPVRAIASGEYFTVGWLGHEFYSRFSYVDLESDPFSIHANQRGWSISKASGSIAIEFTREERGSLVDRVGDYLIMSRSLIDDGFSGVAMALIDLENPVIFYALSGFAGCARCASFGNIQGELLVWLEDELETAELLSERLLNGLKAGRPLLSREEI